MNDLPKSRISELKECFLQWRNDYDPTEDAPQYSMFSDAMAAMDMLLEGMEQKPVAYMYRDNIHTDSRFSLEPRFGNWSPEDINEYEISETPLYTAPVVSDPALMDSEPVAEITEDLGRLFVKIHFPTTLKAGDKLYRHAQQPVVVPDERDFFERWILTQIDTTKITLVGLRTPAGYSDECGTGEEANRLWRIWNSIKAAMLNFQPQNAQQNIPENIPGTLTNEDTKQVQSRIDESVELLKQAVPQMLTKKGPDGALVGRIKSNYPAMLNRWLIYGLAMQESGSNLPHNLIAETEELLSISTNDPTDDERILAIEGIIPPLSGNSPVIPDGWALVPKEPTSEMLNAAWISHGIYHPSSYRTMLAAAPQPPAPEA